MHEHAVRPAEEVLNPGAVAAAAALGFLPLVGSATGVLPWASGLDIAVHSWLVERRSPAVVSVAAALTATASSAFIASVVFVVTAALTRERVGRRLARAALVTAVVLLAALVRLGLSVVIARPRPLEVDWAVQPSGFAFPSGHTSDAVVAAGLLAWLAGKRWAGCAGVRGAVWAAAAGYVAAIGWTRVYLGVHWLTDVLGSLAFGTASLSVALAVRRAMRLSVSAPGRLRRGPSTEDRT